MSLFESADWFSLAPEDQEATIAQDFDRLAQQDPNFQNADPTTQEQYRLAHRQLVEERIANSPNNPKWQEARDAQLTTDYQGTGANLLDKLIASHKDTLARGQLIPGMTDTNPDMDWATQASKYIEKRNLAPQTAERKQLANDMASWSKSWDHSDGLGKTLASIKLAGDLITNPVGVLDVAAESAASMTVIGAGAAAGTAIGAGVTAATGGLAAPIAPAFTVGGMWSAEAIDAASSKFIEKLETRLKDAGIEPTPTNIKVWMENNQDLVAEDQKSSMVYGGALGAADIALGGFFSKMATAPVRAARQAATRSVDDVTRAALATEATKLGVPVDKLITQHIENEAAKILAGQTFKSKLGNKVLSYSGEVISEPTSEAIGTVAAGDKIKGEELIYETIGGVGAGPYGAAINTAAMGSKLAADQTKGFVQKIIEATPESKAAAAQTDQDLQASKERLKARAEHKFKEKAANIDINGDEFKTLIDPGHKNFNPQKALAVINAQPELSSVTDSHLEAIQIGLFEKLDQQDKKSKQVKAALDQAKAAGADTAAINNLERQYGNEIEVQKSLLNELAVGSKHIQALRIKRDQIDNTRQIDPITKESEPEAIEKHVLETLGSSNPMAVTGEEMQNISKTALPESTSQIVENAIQNKVARDNLKNLVDKSMAEVHSDIFKGNPTQKLYKGVDHFLRNIREAISSGDTDSAAKEIAGLKKFGEARQVRSEFITRILAGAKDGSIKTVKQGDRVVVDVEALNEADKTIYKQMQAENPKFYIGSASDKMETIGRAEVAAIDASIKLAESLTANFKGKPSPKAGSENKTAPGANTAVSRKFREDVFASTEQGVIDYLVLHGKNAADYDIKKSPSGRYSFAPKAPAPVETPADSGAQSTAAPDTNAPVVEPEAKNEEVTVPQVPSSESQEVASKINDQLSEEFQNDFEVDFNKLAVTYTDTDGQEKTAPYHEVRAELEERLQEAKDILACFG